MPNACGAWRASSAGTQAPCRAVAGQVRPGQMRAVSALGRQASTVTSVSCAHDVRATRARAHDRPGATGGDQARDHRGGGAIDVDDGSMAPHS